MKDSTVNAICVCAKLMIPRLLRFENDIDVGEKVVLLMAKGEALPLGITKMTTAVATCDIEVVARLSIAKYGSNHEVIRSSKLGHDKEMF